jgi:hypothetical protein
VLLGLRFSRIPFPLSRGNLPCATSASILGVTRDGVTGAAIHLDVPRYSPPEVTQNSRNVALFAWVGGEPCATGIRDTSDPACDRRHHDALLVAVVLEFGLLHVVPNRHLFPQNEVMRTIHLRRPAYPHRDASGAILRDMNCRHLEFDISVQGRVNGCRLNCAGSVALRRPQAAIYCEPAKSREAFSRNAEEVRWKKKT